MKGLFLSLLMLIMSPAISAAADPISVKAEINKGFITIGERAQYTVLIKHSKKIRLITQIDFPNRNEFEVKKTTELPSKEDSEFITIGKRFEITAYGLGDFVINEVEIRYLDEQNQEKSIMTNKLYVTVESVDKSGKQALDIRGIKGPMQLRSTILKWIAAAGSLAVFLLAGWLLWKRYAAGKDLAGSQALILTPHDEALQALQKLYDSSLIRDGKVKEYYLRLSEILKIYFERRFHIQVLEKTTYELKQALRETEIDDGARRLIVELFEDADIVKFAKYMPQPAEIIKNFRTAKEIVERTKPLDTIPAAEPAGKS